MTSGIVTVMRDASDYARRKAWIAEYFDRTAAARWAQLTSDAPVGRVRAAVRAARARMQATLSHWLPDDLSGLRVLDAGCGTGLLSIELAERGANVVAIDLSPTLVSLALERAPQSLRDRLQFRSGDMSDPTLGVFDYVVAMDSVIHYRAPEMLSVVGAFAARARHGVLFTVVPRTPLLTAMLAVGRVFPHGSRSPSVEPVSDDVLTDGLKTFATGGWHLKRVERVSAGFYTSQACELIKQEVAS